MEMPSNTQHKDTRFNFEVTLTRGQFLFASTPELVRGRLELVTQCYREEGFIQASDLTDGLFIDPFELRGIPYVVVDENGRVIVSVRLIFAKLGRLPMKRLQLHPVVVKNLSRANWCEWTQVVVDPDYRHSYRLFSDITSIAIQLAWQGGATRWGAVVNESLFENLVGRFGKPPIMMAGNPQTLNYAPYRDSELLYPIMAFAHDVYQKEV